MKLRSPLSLVLGSGSAKDGTNHWWVQRVSAVGLVLLGLWFVISLQQLNSFSYSDIVYWIQQPLVGVMLILLSLTMAYHSRIGIQVIIEDYVHGPFSKVIFLVVSNFVHAFLALVAVFAVLRIAFGTPV